MGCQSSESGNNYPLPRGLKERQTLTTDNTFYNDAFYYDPSTTIAVFPWSNDSR